MEHVQVAGCVACDVFVINVQKVAKHYGVQYASIRRENLLPR